MKKVVGCETLWDILPVYLDLVERKQVPYVDVHPKGFNSQFKKGCLTRSWT